MQIFETQLFFLPLQLRSGKRKILSSNFSPNTALCPMPDFKQFTKIMTQAISAAALSAALSSGAAALEPVSPQPSQPLTYTNPAYAKVTPETAKKMMAEGVVVIDVREPQEFAEGHVQGAVNVPLSTFHPGMRLEAAPDFNQKVLVQCRSGVRVERAAKILIESGYKHIYNMYGTMQWPYELVREAARQQK